MNMARALPSGKVGPIAIAFVWTIRRITRWTCANMKFGSVMRRPAALSFPWMDRNALFRCAQTAVCTPRFPSVPGKVLRWNWSCSPFPNKPAWLRICWRLSFDFRRTINIRSCNGQKRLRLLRWNNGLPGSMGLMCGRGPANAPGRPCLRAQLNHKNGAKALAVPYTNEIRPLRVRKGRILRWLRCCGQPVACPGTKTSFCHIIDILFCY